MESARAECVYRDYIFSFEYDPSDHIYHGKIEGISDLFTFGADTFDGAIKAGENAIDEYEEWLNEL